MEWWIWDACLPQNHFVTLNIYDTFGLWVLHLEDYENITIWKVCHESLFFLKGRTSKRFFGLLDPNGQTLKTRVRETFYPWLTEFVIFEEATLYLGFHQINSHLYIVLAKRQMNVQFIKDEVPLSKEHIKQLPSSLIISTLQAKQWDNLFSPHYSN